jgi:hypothetical protein
MARCVLLRSVRSTPIENNTLTIRTFLCSPQSLVLAAACTASFCVLFFYMPTVGLRWPSRRVECVPCVRRTSDGSSSSSPIQGCHELARVLAVNIRSADLGTPPQVFG